MYTSIYTRDIDIDTSMNIAINIYDANLNSQDKDTYKAIDTLTLIWTYS